MCTEDSPSGLWRTLGKRVGCKPSGVRIPHPPPPDPGTASGSGVFVACCDAGVPGAGGSGRCVCRWAAARPRAVRAASFARRVVSKPGQAPPPPTGTAAGPSGALHTGGTCVAWTSPARPRRRPRAPQPGSLHIRAVEPSLLSPHSISHAIPSQFFQTMNFDCWNCNVFRCC